MKYHTNCFIHYEKDHPKRILADQMINVLNITPASPQESEYKIICKRVLENSIIVIKGNLSRSSVDTVRLKCELLGANFEPEIDNKTNIIIVGDEMTSLNAQPLEGSTIVENVFNPSAYMNQAVIWNEQTLHHFLTEYATEEIIQELKLAKEQKEKEMMLEKEKLIKKEARRQKKLMKLLKLAQQGLEVKDSDEDE